MANDNIYSDFAYDDAYRTIGSECDDLLIPYVNYFHNESYDKTAKVIRGRNEHFIGHQDHSQDKRITDASFVIEYGGQRKKYHHEAESSKYDDSMLIRMFEYDAEIALDDAEIDGHLIRVAFPYSGILVLRGKRSFERAYVEILTSGGNVRYPVEVQWMSDIDLDIIFEKHLYYLLPFYIFNLEDKLDEINRDDSELEDFSEVYRDIVAKLEEDVGKEYLSAYSQSVIISLIHKVAYKMTMKRENVQERVGDIMGGKVMDLEVIRAHRDGIAEGKAEGIAEERMANIKKLAASYIKNDPSLTEERALEMARSILG